MFRSLIEFLILQTILWKGFSQSLDWNPFDEREGQVFRYVPHQPSPDVQEYLAQNRAPEEVVSKTGIDESQTIGDTNNDSIIITISSKSEKSLRYRDSLIAVPEMFHYKCKEESGENSVYVASSLHRGSYCLLMDVLFSCLFKANRSNGYPVVQSIKVPDKRYDVSKQNSALLMGRETHIFSYFFACSYFGHQRIRCESKEATFPALSGIIPTSSFSYQDPNDDLRWILVVDTISKSGEPQRLFIENGRKLLATVPQEYEINATTIYLRHKNYIEGYSFVQQFYYKFFFSTKSKEFYQSNEMLRMLWGNNQEFIGCPKSLCSASVVDTVIKLKDNTTYIFVGKYYWNLTDGLSVDKAVFIDADSPFDTHFPYLSSDIESSFYDSDEDEAYLIKGQYVYSYIKTGAVPPDRTTPNLNGVHISRVFRGIPPDMNAAFYYRPNSTVYFFRGFHYWGYDLRLKSLLNGYPRPVTDFENMPPNVDAIYSDNFGTYYVLFGTFFAQFAEEDFKIGMKLEFKVSNVDHFGCNESYFDDYKQFKHQMETKFAPVSAKTILNLTDNEGLGSTQSPIKAEKGDIHSTDTTSAHNNTTQDIKRKEQSFLTTFANLILFGPFFYQLFTDETPHKSKQTVFEAFDE